MVLKKLNVEYNALLQMYGEKTEENDELKMDLQDVKDMYKLQVNK
jgi:TATA element modulatory factor